MNKLIMVWFVCALVTTVARAQLDTLVVTTLDGSGHITMTEQPCCISWRGHSYKDVMVRGRGHSFDSYPDKQPMRLRFPKRTALLAADKGNDAERVSDSDCKAKKWVVLAMNDDPSMMRDAVAWFIARRMGMEYLPAYDYAVVSIDGRCQGICLIADQVEAGPGRVPVKSDGWLAELDGYADGRFFYTACTRLPVRIHYPKGYGDDFYRVADDIMAAPLACGDGGLQFANILQVAEYGCASSAKSELDASTLCAEDWAGVMPWYLTAEIVANPDAYWSLYFYKPTADSPVVFGPIWDSGKAFGNDPRFTGTEQRRLHDFAFNAQWGRNLAAHPSFRAAVHERWRLLDRVGLLRDVLAYIGVLERRLGSDGSALRAFLTVRFAWLEEVFSQV